MIAAVAAALPHFESIFDPEDLLVPEEEGRHGDHIK
jgi:hypothetical protein